jgi:hypothetical protein
MEASLRNICIGGLARKESMVPEGTVVAKQKGTKAIGTKTVEIARTDMVRIFMMRIIMDIR